MKQILRIFRSQYVWAAIILCALAWGCTPKDPEPAPIANFSYGPSRNLEAPVTISFINESKNATSYEWNFDDGTTSTQASPTHTFTEGGTFRVTLTAKNSGGTDQAYAIITVTSNPFGGNNGKLSFWKSSMGEGNTIIKLSNGSTKETTSYWNSVPSCDNTNLPSFILAPGNYTYSAVNESGRQWSGSVTISKSQCTLIELKKAEGIVKLPSGAVIRSTLISRNGGTIRFTLDIAVADIDNTLSTNLQRANFSIGSLTSNNTNYSFSNDGVQMMSGTTSQAYSAALLLDQSGSIQSTDPENSRIEAAKIFCGSLGPNDNVFLSAFASGGKLPYELTYYGNGFTNNGSSYYGTLDNLKNLVDGGTPLYKSTYSVLDYTAQKAPNASKAVVVFTDGKDTEGGISPNTLIQRAKQQNVKLFMVGLKDADIPSLANIANQTGGAFMFAQDAPQLLTMFGTLGKLLDGTANYYRTTWTMTVNPSVPAGGSYYFWSSVQVKIGNRTVYVPFRVDY